MKYYVTYSINARYTAEVEADSLEEAKKKADVEVENADFGVAKAIDSDAVTVEDETGYMYY